MYSVIVIENVFGSFITDHPDCTHINLIHAFCSVSYRDTFPGTDKERHFIERNVHIVNAFLQNLFGNISVGLVVDAAEENVETDTVNGHAVLKYTVTPGKRADVWTGSGWSKGGIESPEAWAEAVRDFAYAQAHPLRVTVSR